MKRVRLYIYFVVCVGGLYLFGCNADGEHEQAGSSENQVTAFDPAFIKSERENKDAEFSAGNGPIPENRLESFRGLDYYPILAEFAVNAEFRTLDMAEEVELAVSNSDKSRPMIRYGVFRFVLDGKQCSLSAFKHTGVDGRRYPLHLFVPFSDKTNGNSTYSAGRYLDVVEVPGQKQYLLDFNRSYNPYCAYNENYVCPLVPQENMLPVAVRSGEKAFAASLH